MGAWYPLNWPFFGFGIRPKSMLAQVMLHAVLAAIGTYTLLRQFGLGRAASAFGGALYPLSGFWSAHIEHVSMLQAAMYLPWILLAYLRAEAGSRRWLALGILLSGSLCLTGHFQTILYTFTAVGFIALLRAAQARRLLALAPVAAFGVGALALSAVQVLPSYELLGESLRSRLSATDRTIGIMTRASLATLIYPNAAEIFQDPYRGPIDITQHYFYCGLLLLPLVLVGLTNRAVRVAALVLILPALWYAVGPPGGLFLLAAKFPGFGSIRAPNHVMFVALLGLIGLASAGVDRLCDNRRWLAAALALTFFVDLAWFNLLHSPTAYAHSSYDEAYGAQVRWFRDLVKPPLLQGERLASPNRWVYFYPAMAPFDEEVETTFGSNALILTRYYEYLLAMNRNPKLMSVLGVSRYFDSTNWEVKTNPPLPRFSFPARVETVSEEAAILNRLATMDADTALLLQNAPNIAAQQTPGDVRIVRWSESAYEVEAKTPARSLMRIAIPRFPGWQASLDGQPVAILPVDHALMGVLIPTGEHRLRLWFHSTYLASGALISGLGLACVIALLIRRESDQKAR